MRKAAVLLALAIAFSLAGCARGPETVRERYPEYCDIPPVLDPGDGSKDRYNAALLIYNYSNGTFSMLMDAYLVEFGYDIEPGIKDNFSARIAAPAESDISRLRGAVALTEKVAESSGVYHDAAEFGHEMLKLCDSLEKTRGYLESRGYRSDGFAQLRREHSQFVIGVDRYFAAYDAFSPKILELAETEEQAAAERYETGGMAVFSRGQRCYLAVKAVVDAIKTDGLPATAGDTALLSPQLLSPAADRLDEELEALRSAASDAAELKKEGLDAKKASDYIQELEKTAAQARELLKNIAERHSFTQDEIKNAVKTPGTPERLRAEAAGAVTAFCPWFE